MIAKLYAPNTTDFTTNGIGRLPDVTESIVHEQRNGVFELEMEMPTSGLHFDDIELGSIIVTKPSPTRTAQPFRVYSIEKTMGDMMATICAEHIGYQLNLIPVMPYTANSASTALQGLSTYAAETNPFTFWTDITRTGTYKQTLPSSARSRLQGEQGSIVQTYFGEIEFDEWTVKLWENRGVDRGTTIRYGKNLMSLEQDANIQDTITGIVPYWVGMEGETESILWLPEVVLYSEHASDFPTPRTVCIDFSQDFQEKPTVAELRAAGNKYIEDNQIGVPKVGFDVTFATLAQTTDYKDIALLERLDLCDFVTVIFPDFGISAKAKITEIYFDTLNERYTKVRIGDQRFSLSDQIAQQGQDIANSEAKQTNSFLQALDQATALINGDLTGASMVTQTDANGNPVGLIFMDTNDPGTAVNCIRINSNGIGFSNNGVNGPYSSTWTIDNTFNAANINVINLSASSINTGTLKDSLTNGTLFYLNTETGEVHIKSIDDNVLSNQNSISELYQSLDNTTEELTSVKGSVTSLSSDLSDFKEETSTTISQTADRIEFDFDQRITQANNAISENSSELEDIHRYIRFVNGNIELGEEGSPIKQVIQNDRDSFYYNGVEVAYISDNKLYITEAEILSGIVIGKHKWLARGDRMTLVYTG